MQPDQRVSRLELVSLANAADLAGLHTRDVLRRWSWPGPLDIAWIVVAELVNSALARPVPIPTQLNHPMLDAARPLRLTLQWSGGPLSIELFDSDPAPSQIWATHPQHQGGRGLALVAAYCSRWSYHFPPEGGKVLWCELTATPALPAAAASAPRAIESGQPATGQWSGPRPAAAQPVPPPMPQPVPPPMAQPPGSPNGWAPNGYAADGRPQDGWAQNGGGYPDAHNGWAQEQRAQNGWHQNGWDRDRPTQNGWDRDRETANGWDRNPAAPNGWERDRDPGAPNGWDRDRATQNGWDRDGETANGWPRDGSPRKGWTEDARPQNGWTQDGWAQDSGAPESPPTGNPGYYSQPARGYQGR